MGICVMLGSYLGVKSAIKFGGKFISHNEVLDSFPLSDHVELEGNARFTFGFLY